jgi:cytochrome c5
MPAPEVWGPATWTLFHVLAEKVNEFVYPRIAGQLFDVIRRICSALPCPECAQDATIFLSKVKIQELRSKNDFKNMIYMFHNYVNAKKRKPLFNYANLEIYKRYNIVSVFNRFISVYHTKGNMRLLAESFQRQLIVRNVREWFSRNICFFVPTQQPHSGITVSEEVIGVEAPVSEVESNCCGYTKEPISSEVVQEVLQEEVIAPELVQEEVIAPDLVQEEVVQEEVVQEVVVQEVVQEEVVQEVVPVENTVVQETKPVAKNMVMLTRELYESKNLYENSCNKCHNIYVPSEFTKEQWPKILKSMQKNAELSDPQIAGILDYINSQI